MASAHEDAKYENMIDVYRATADSPFDIRDAANGTLWMKRIGFGLQAAYTANAAYVQEITPNERPN